MADTLKPDELRRMDAYWRAANYLSVGQIYLLDNPLLREPLTLKHIKPTAYRIDAARGPLVDTEALMDALGEERLAGAALDVTDPEPMPDDHPIMQFHNVIVTCHSAANSLESYVDCQSHAPREVVRVLKGEPPATPMRASCRSPMCS